MPAARLRLRDRARRRLPRAAVATAARRSPRTCWPSRSTKRAEQTRGFIDIDNASGAYAGPPAPIAIGNLAGVSWGYRTASGLQASRMADLWIASYEYRRTGGAVRAAAARRRRLGDPAAQHAAGADRPHVRRLPDRAAAHLLARRPAAHQLRRLDARADRRAEVHDRAGRIGVRFGAARAGVPGRPHPHAHHRRRDDHRAAGVGGQRLHIRHEPSRCAKCRCSANRRA